ncbi:nonstructural protein [Astrovirus Er/SZAL6/HUN/2011]|uniref:nonstructural protein n=1 Tax=Astrovirus Er/SZAL6/HUN/2011 TaxID=1671382 RepID=UPI0006526404|nr:nonstructural protein [Astrovirus Er/SZAL6/HUN/2011]AKM71246.1 nonstructural protein [Astrovirus Er/SZAL6/HUN/2011]
MAGSGAFYASKVDAAMNLGSFAARSRITTSMQQELRKLYHDQNVPWTFHHVPKLLIYPAPTNDYHKRVVVASAVDFENEWCTYVWDDDWKPIPPSVPVPPGALVGVMLNQKARDKEQILALKQELSEQRVQNGWLVHQLARYRQASHPTPPRSGLSKATLALCVLIFFMSFWLSTNATETEEQKPARSQRYEEIQERIEQLLNQRIRNMEIANYYNTWVGYAEDQWRILVEKLYDSGDWYFVLFLDGLKWTLENHIWHMVSVVMAVLSLWKGTNPRLAVLYLAAATISTMRFAMLAIAPWHTPTSATVCTVVALIYMMFSINSPSHSWAPGHRRCSFLGCVLPDASYIQHMKAHTVTAIVFLAAHAFVTVGVSPSYIGFALVLYRCYTLLPATAGATIEVRDVSGKVTHKVNTPPNAVFRFAQKAKAVVSKMARFSQLRTGVSPMVRASPGALVIIETKDGKGSGFAAGNYIVTAEHVVGTAQSVQVHYNGASYPTTVHRTFPGRDIALLKMPHPLQGAIQRLKIAKTPKYDWVCVTAPTPEGALLTSVTPGMCHGTTISYATPTIDGMSGAPVVDENGHVLGVHQTNTGYTGGAVVIRPEDLLDAPKENPQVRALQEEIAALKAQLQQCQVPATKPDLDIVALVREAMQREMQILREELADELGDEFNQGKKSRTAGRKKNKRGRGRMKTQPGYHHAARRRQRGPMFTEQQYQEMLDSGMTVDEIKALAEYLYEQQNEEAGFPEWSDYEASDDDWQFGEDDYNDEYSRRTGKRDRMAKDMGLDPSDLEGQPGWNENPASVIRVGSKGVWNSTFGMKQCKTPPVVCDDVPKYEDYPEFDVTSVGRACCETTLAERKLLGAEILNVMKAAANGDLTRAVYDIDRKAQELGLEKFSQRLKPKAKQQPKNGGKGTQDSSKQQGPQNPSTSQAPPSPKKAQKKTN